ncbi:MAG: hypothetical protein CMB79_04305 [Filomicrobium sp.]|nr:hypothetical protein [Filomicrobium sp.]
MAHEVGSASRIGEFIRIVASTVHRLLVSADILNRERSRWFLWVPVCFAIGIAAYFELRFEPSLAYLALPLVGTIVLICSQHRVRANQPLAVALMLVVAGASVSKLRTI